MYCAAIAWQGRELLLISILLITASGCAARDNSNFQQFNIQSTTFAEETATILEPARGIVEINLINQHQREKAEEVRAAIALLNTLTA